MLFGSGCVIVTLPSVFAVHSGGRSGFFLSSALSSLEVLKESWEWGATGGGGARQVNCRKLRWGRGASEVGSGSFPQLLSAPTQLGGGRGQSWEAPWAWGTQDFFRAWGLRCLGLSGS